jgi:hypothetical protein
VKVVCDHPAAGVARVIFNDTGRRLVFRCDPESHSVSAIDQTGRVLFVIGRRGRELGQFDTPLDVAIVRPEFFGEPLVPESTDMVWLAVADYGNRRVQVLELNGAAVGSIPTGDGDDAIGPPCGLRWRAPLLEIEGADGARTQMHLSAALLWSSTQSAEAPRRAWPSVPVLERA